MTSLKRLRLNERNKRDEGCNSICDNCLCSIFNENEGTAMKKSEKLALVQYMCQSTSQLKLDENETEIFLNRFEKNEKIESNNYI